jgi:hypothetical protein
MLLRDLKNITELDEKISALHAELEDLYKQRSSFVLGDVVPQALDHKTFTVDKPNDDWLQYEYQRLSTAWATYGIQIPELNKLETKLINARGVILNLAEGNPSLDHKLSIVLVPPSNLFNMDKLADMRQAQTFVLASDYIATKLQSNYRAKKWRVLVVFSDVEGLEIGNAKDIINNQLFKIDGQDMRGLGLYEYLALSLQHPAPLDLQGWTLLLKGYKTGDVPSVSYTGGHYRFETDDARGILGDERFRPAIEVV